MKYLMLCLAVLVCPACTTTTSIGSSGSELQALSNSNKLDLTNKTISVNTKQNIVTDARVLSTTEESLITNKGEIRFADIHGLAVKKVSVQKTVIGVVSNGIIGVLAVYGAVLIVSTGALIAAIVDSKK